MLSAVSIRPRRYAEIMAGHPAQDHADRRAEEAHHERDAGPVDEPAQDVAVEVVGAEQMAPARARRSAGCCSSPGSGWAAGAGWR